MANVDPTIHRKMYARFKLNSGLLKRIAAAVYREWNDRPVYGMKWGDPELVPPLRYVKERFIMPYVDEEKTAVEIGPGGGRWTRYLLGFGLVYAVDHYSEILDELRANYKETKIVPVVNSGCDFPGLMDASVDYVFSFGTFVHLDEETIGQYLKNMKRIVKRDADIVIQYSDKRKEMAKQEKNFSDMTPERMRKIATEEGYEIVEEDLTTLWHSSVVRMHTAAKE